MLIVLSLHVVFKQKAIDYVFLLAILSRHFLAKPFALLCFLGVLRYVCVLFLCKNLYLKKGTVSITSSTKTKSTILFLLSLIIIIDLYFYYHGSLFLLLLIIIMIIIIMIIIIIFTLNTLFPIFTKIS